MFNTFVAGRVFKDTIYSYCASYSNKVTNILVSNIISRKLIEYSSLDFMSYDETKSEVMECISFDTFNLSRLKNDLILSINNSLFDIEDNAFSFEGLNIKFKNNLMCFDIPYGLINNNVLLNSFGPNIPVSLKLIGDSICNIDCNVSNYSINTILIKILLKIEINMMVYIPLKSEKMTVINEYPIALKIIQGNIPNTYLGSYPIIS